MCGIAGLMTLDGGAPDEKVLQALTTALAHRGPDGQGLYVSGGTALVQTRLSIIDLETGDQPLYEQGVPQAEAAVLVANGEFYNYRELRADMPEVDFATKSDCEPPLYLYRRHGLDFVQHLRGMYALAIYDPSANQLILSRDPFGIKPLYYVETENCFAFASEIQALVGAGLIEAAINPIARDELFQLQFTTGADSIVAGVKRVAPGETLVIEAGRIIARRSLPALPGGGPREISDDQALQRLDDALMQSVELHQRADVPYGMFLSGGVDSSALLALMARLNDTPVRAYTAGFPGTAAADERDYAREVAEAVGAEHIDVPVSEGDFWRNLPRIAAAMDDPAADYAIVPTYLLGQAAGADLKVVLTGEGGDELFGGYGRYRAARRPRWLGGKSMHRRGSFDGLDILRQTPTHWRDGFAASEHLAKTQGRTALQVAQATDCADWLPNDLLTKADRCLMAHGLEGRVPFLDSAVAEAAFCLPDRLKIEGRLGKILLRRWLDKALPVAGAFSKKRGFTVPVGEWIADRGAELGPLVAAQPGVAEACKPDQVVSLFATLQTKTGDKRLGFAAWTILFYALWHHRHILVGATSGDVFETLDR